MSARDDQMDQAENALGEVLDFMRVIWALDHAMHQTSKRMERQLGVTGPQRLVLRVVGRFPAISAGRLAKLLHIHPSTLTGVLRRLEAQQMIIRRADPDDLRRSLLSLTDKGRAFDVDTAGTIEAAVGRALAITASTELHATRSVLDSIVVELGRGTDQEKPTAP